MKCLQALLLGIGLLAAVPGAQAEDSVAIRYVSGMPLPTQGFERLDVRVTRFPSPMPSAESPIDRFFASVDAVLSEARIEGDWQLVIPDAPYIEITVELGERRVVLASAHVPLERNAGAIVTEQGARSLEGRARKEVIAEQDEEHQRRRTAFDRILALTLARLQTQLSP